MLNITVDKILIYHDQPELFIAKDQVGAKYICLHIETGKDYVEYIALPVSINKLNSLILGNLDLRDAFLTSEIGVWYQLAINANEEFIAKPFEFSSITEEYLPDAGFFFPTIESEEETIVKEAIEKENAIVHLSFVDEQNRHSMEVNILADFIKLFQGLVKNSFKKTIASILQRKELDRPNNYSLRAFATSPGSFNIHLESEANIDLFGNSNIEIALEKIDFITGEITSEDESLEKIRPLKGHTVSTYKKLLEKIIKHNIKFSYKWISPASNTIHKKTIDKIYAEKMYEILTSKSELSQEVRELIGYVKQADVEKGNWRILNIEDNKEYSGQAKSIRLDGITLETIMYKFKCEEIIEELKVNELEKVSFILLEFSPVE
ncbi:MAG: hypothetical protein IPP56_16445 [Bacteroidetes bacterium]|nr:hypothetical protein [Bacteroidota bacterium]MBK9801236.1 hypothetical protein [Bacteroidota bacterium]